MPKKDVRRARETSTRTQRRPASRFTARVAPARRYSFLKFRPSNSAEALRQPSSFHRTSPNRTGFGKSGAEERRFPGPAPRALISAALGERTPRGRKALSENPHAASSQALPLRLTMGEVGEKRRKSQKNKKGEGSSRPSPNARPSSLNPLTCCQAVTSPRPVSRNLERDSNR